MTPVLKLGFCPPLLQFRDAEWSFHFLSKRILNEKHPLLCLLSHETGSPVAACRRSCSLYCSVKSHGEDCGVKRRAATHEKGFYPHVIKPVNRHNSRPLLRLKIVGADTKSPVENARLVSLANDGNERFRLFPFTYWVCWGHICRHCRLECGHQIVVQVGRNYRPELSHDLLNPFGIIVTLAEHHGSTSVDPICNKGRVGSIKYRKWLFSCKRLT